MIQEELLERVLESREERANYQKLLLEEYGLPLISLTLNLPGGYFQYDKWRLLWECALESIKTTFTQDIVFKETKMGKWGMEGFFVVRLPVSTIKAETIKIEDNHLLGRLFDIDLINVDGTSMSRRDFNMDFRLCLVCNNPALDCYINKVHSYDEVKMATEKIIEKGLENDDKGK